MQPLYVVAVISNPARYRSRYALYVDFAKRCADAGAVLYTVEAAFGDRPHAVTSADNPRHIQLRTGHELWHKENLWNVGVSRLPAAAEYVAMVDADFQFARPDWAEETVHQLQHYRVVQMFSEVSYLSPEHVTLRTAPGFAYLHRQTTDTFARPSVGSAALRLRPRLPRDYAQAVRECPPGGAWAYRREELFRCGGLMDHCILGSADMYMAHALIGGTAPALRGRGFHPNYVRLAADWAARAERWLRRDVGWVSGTALHYWHGRLQQRGYGHRDGILTRLQFDPLADLVRDHQGLWQLDDDGSERHARLRDELRAYFASRNEDGIDL